MGTYHCGNGADQENDTGDTSSQQSDGTARETKALEHIRGVVDNRIDSCD